MDLSSFKPILDALGVQPALYPLMLALGVINQYGKGMNKWWTLQVSFWIAVAAGLLSMTSVYTDHMEIGPAAVRAVALTAACLIAETAAELAAKKLPFVPKDNEWAKEDAPKG